MFTGLVLEPGTVVAVGRRDRLTVLTIRATKVRPRVGDSVAVNGVCLTTTATVEYGFTADVMHETLAHTTLAALRPGDRVNLEPALRASGALDGHLMTGHVDATGVVSKIASEGAARRVRIAISGDLGRYIARKGSVGVDGVSLTVAEAGRQYFDIALIPQTLQLTTLGQLRVGHRVNIEVDLVARYLERLQSTTADDMATAEVGKATLALKPWMR